jgi:glycosyltransferase involved in cell wall biosynthesis
MVVPLRKESWVDPSKKAENVLDYVLEDISDEAVAQREAQSPVDEELHKAPLAHQVSTREKSRVLFITGDVKVLEADSIFQKHFRNMRDVFDEIHVIVLSRASQAKKGVQRIEQNVWVYSTSATYWWSAPLVAQSIAKSQLVFADGFRADVVVSLDPFESGVAGYLIASKYDREFQVHVMEDFFDPEFKEKDKNNDFRLRVASFVLGRAQSVRTSTTAIKNQIEKNFVHLKDIALLPRHYNINEILELSASPNLKDLFPQYVFVVLFIGKLDYESTLFRAMDASRSVLHSKSIGLVVVGNGPSKKEFQERATILGIQEQVIFERDESRLIEYLKSADVLLCTDTTEASDELVIKAAAAGLPILASKTPMRNDLFVDGESAFLCEKEDTIEFSQKLTKFINTNALRTQFATNALDIVKTRLHEDPEVYKRAYRDSIEGVFSDEDPEITPQTLPEIV